ncbi:unnamed protein product, partial [Bubo scandiacus]
RGAARPAATCAAGGSGLAASRPWDGHPGPATPAPATPSPATPAPSAGGAQGRRSPSPARPLFVGAEPPTR